MIGSDYETPIMYQDLANFTMGPMSPFMGGTSYLGGVQMRQQPDRDKIEIMNRKEGEAKNTAKKVAIALGALFLIGFCPRIAKGIKKAGGPIKYVKQLWHNFRTPKPKTSYWQKIKNFFSRKKTTP